MMSSPAASFLAPRHGGVDEAAGVDDHQIGAVVRFCGLVTFSAELGQDLFGIDQRFRAAERNEAHFRCWRAGGWLGNTGEWLRLHMVA